MLGLCFLISPTNCYAKKNKSVFLLGSFPIPRLKEAEDARTTCVSIEGLECSAGLRDALIAHADAMTELYRNPEQNGC